MIDKQRLTDALLYEGLRHLYNGDLLYDAGVMLQNSVNAEEYKTDLKDTIRSECLSQLPEEDFLCDIIDQLHDLKGLKKAEIIEKIGFIIECLEDKQQCQANASAYAFDVLKSF